MPGKDGTPAWWGTSTIPYTSEDKPFYLPFTQSLKETLGSFGFFLSFVTDSWGIRITEEWFCNYLTITTIYGDIFTLISCMTCENIGDNYIIVYMTYIRVYSIYPVFWLHMWLYTFMLYYLYLYVSVLILPGLLTRGSLIHRNYCWHHSAVQKGTVKLKSNSVLIIQGNVSCVKKEANKSHQTSKTSKILSSTHLISVTLYFHCSI